MPAAYASCVIGKRDDDCTELTDVLPSEIGEVSAIPDTSLLAASQWTGRDSKFERFEQILSKIWETDPSAKVLVFSYFKGTVRYLEKRLEDSGVRTLRIDGDVPSEPRHPERDERGRRIANFKDDASVKVLVSTEVGSEGLDFQFCHHLVNYDLPWNPMVVEQRIGRIDRLGQKSDKIFIHNLVMSGTVEDQILNRLYERIGIFEKSIGATEAIVGDEVKSLLNDYLSGKLTNLSESEKHQRADEAANAISRRDRMLEELADKATQLLGHEEHVREELSRVRKLGQCVSNKSMLSVLETYFRTKHPAVRIDCQGEDVYAIEVSDALRLDIQDAARKRGGFWSFIASDKILRFTTTGEVAFERLELQLINPSHPLMLAATEGLADQMSLATAKLGAARLMVDPSECPEIAEGDYFIVLTPQQVFGINERRLIDTVAVSHPNGHVLDADSGSRLLALVIEQGEPWFGDAPPTMPTEIWASVEAETRQRCMELRQREATENQALHVRRRNSLIAEHQYHMKHKRQRLKTSEANKQAKAIRLFEAQIEKAIAKHRDALDQLDHRQTVRVVHESPIAVCVVRVAYVSGTVEVLK